MSEPAEPSPANSSAAGDDSDPDFVKRRMLRFRSWHRGTKECDLMLGSFADRHVESFTPDQLDGYAALLENNDPDIYDWATGRAPVPPEFDTDVMKLLKAHRFVGVTDMP